MILFMKKVFLKRPAAILILLRQSGGYVLSDNGQITDHSDLSVWHQLGKQRKTRSDFEYNSRKEQPAEVDLAGFTPSGAFLFAQGNY